MRYSIVLPAIVAVANAAPATLNERGLPVIPIPSIHAPGQCLPSGYFQALDKGQPSSLKAVTYDCAKTCADDSRCHAIVVQTWDAADTDLFTAQCFFYPSAPSPVTCAQGPSTISGYKIGPGDSEPEPTPTPEPEPGSCSSEEQLELSNVGARNLNTDNSDLSFDLSGTSGDSCGTTCSATWPRSSGPSGEYSCEDGTTFTVSSPNNSITDLEISFPSGGSVSISSGSGGYICARGSGEPVLSACSSSETFTTS